MNNTLHFLGAAMLYGTLQRALPLLEGDHELIRQAKGIQALCERRMGLTPSRPTRAERRRPSEEERYRHE